MKVTNAGQPMGEILSPVSQALSPASDLASGRADVQSSGLTHWDPVKSQCNLTLSGDRYTRVSPSHEWLGGGSPTKFEREDKPNE